MCGIAHDVFVCVCVCACMMGMHVCVCVWAGGVCGGVCVGPSSITKAMARII